MKPAISVEEAVGKIPERAVVMFGGFMGVGTPERLMDEIVRQGRGGLTVIGNDTARPGVGVGKLIDAGLVAKAIVSHIGTNPVTQRGMIEGRIEVELVPQGTLVERIRAAGFGLGGVLTPTGVGTLAAEGKRIVEVEGRPFLLELPLRADFALLRASAADYCGNLTYRLTSENFNPIMATAAATVICDPAEILPVGAIPPDDVETPGVLVDYLVARGAA